MRPAVILARVSTPEQEAGHSLEAQLANLQAYAERKELKVTQVFRIIESSTKGYRPEFERMIDFLKGQKQRHALIVDCVDRLQRSFTHTPVLNSLMEKDLLEIHFVREGNVIDKNATSMQKMMWNIGTVMAQSYTDQLADNVRRSIKHKLEKGEWIAQAPLGYLNATDPASSRSLIVIDPQRAPLVQRLFLEYAAGVSSMAELARKTKDWGLLSRKTNKPLGTQTVASILSNPFYSGLMRIKGHLYPHTYPQLVEHSVFRACELRKRNAGLPQQAIRKTRYPFLFRGLVTCATSGRKVSCSLQKGKYVYLITRDPKNKNEVLWVKEEAVLKQLLDVFRSFQLPEDLLADVLDYIRRSHEAEKELNHQSVKELKMEHSNLSDKLNRLTDLMIDGQIDQKIYEAKHREISMRRTEIACILKDRDGADDGFKDALSNVISLVNRSAEIFESSKIESKRNMIGFLFSNLQLEGATLRYTLKKPFEVLRQVPQNPEWRAREDSNLRPPV